MKSNQASQERTSQQLADFLASVRFEDIPTTVLEDARRSILDGFGSLFAGSLEPSARMARRVLSRMGVSTDATVFGGGRSSAAGAAFANGLATHILELDDIHKGSTIHAAAPIIPAALAVAEREHRSGRDFLLAVILGYEAALRIGEAINPSHYRFWHPTGTAATFGAAVAAGHLLGLDAGQMLHALGSAGSQAAGLWEFNADGAMSKALHPGKAAMNGVIAADLALEGFTGASRILEGERGFFRATTHEYDETLVLRDIGNIWKISENGYKLHSCCGHTHTAIDAALELRAQLGAKLDLLERIESVQIETYGPGFEIVKEMNPRTPYQAKFSLAYVVAAALLEGAVGLEQFAADRFDDSGVIERRIQRLLSRVRVDVSPELTAMYPMSWSNRLRLHLKDGRMLEAGGDFPRGNAENPVSTLELEAKFSHLMVPRFGVDVTNRALGVLRNWTQIENMRTAFADLLPGTDSSSDAPK